MANVGSDVAVVEVGQTWISADKRDERKKPFKITAVRVGSVTFVNSRGEMRSIKTHRLFSKRYILVAEAPKPANEGAVS